MTSSRFLGGWLASPLERHILLRLALVAGLLSLLLLAIFLTAYRSQLEAERSRASMGFNLLLQATLENAMLKRDVPGLKDIVERLGRQPGIRAVMILNPAGEVRFASRGEHLGRRLPELAANALRQGPAAGFSTDENGTAVLRSVNPVANQPPCAVCHGPAAAHPVNGILVLDYDAAELQRHAWHSGLAFAAAGIALLLVLMAVLWRSLERRVLAPVARLTAASAALEQGRFDERVALDGNDELATLGTRFNRMAERLQTQIALVEAHDTYLQDILDSLPDGVRVIRVADRRVVLANRAHERLLGRESAASVGLYCHQDSHGLDAPCAPTMVVCPLHALKTVGESLKATHRHRDGNGREFLVEIHAALVEIRRGDAALRYVVESVRDLDRSARISQEQRLSELGLLAAGIAHEIHNPLASVRLAVQGLSRDLARERCTGEQLSTYLDLMDGEIDKCITVTRRLLMLSRVPQEQRQIVDLGAALADTLQLLEYDAQSRRIAQRLALPPEPLLVLADESELRMVFLNLIQNAHHAMGPGGEVLARVSLTEGWLFVDIIDSGEGIPPELLPQIFDPFFSRRADGVVGTGLGLTIVKTVVERNGGTVSVFSEPGQGSRFCVMLPTRATEKTAP